jgi:hypothetical protein
MIIINADKNSETGAMPDQALLTAMTKYNEELVKAGIMLGGEGLHPTARGVRVKFSGTDRTVVEGPFQYDHLIAGYWLWQVRSREEAIEWVKRCPNPQLVESEIEIRQVFEAADFGAEFTPELKAREEALRTEIERQHTASAVA